jgi:hypothetical protein
MTRAGSLVLAAALSLAASSAHANVGAAPVPTQLGPLGAAQKTPIEVVHERLKIDCRVVERVFSCSFEAHYELRNPTDKKQEVVAAFYGAGASGVSARIDGEEPAPSASSQDDDLLARSSARFGPTQHAMKIGLDARTSSNLVVIGTLHPADLRKRQGYTIDAVYTRHPLVASKKAEGEEILIEYLIAPIRTWSGAPPIDVEIGVPDGYRLGGADNYRWSAQKGGGRVGVRSFAPGRAPEELALRFEKPPAIVINGGPIVGVGGSWLNDGGLRMKVGWEVARPSWLLYSLNFETDVKDHHYLVPLVQAASPMILFLPSVAAGLGVPIRFAPIARVGGRVQIDVHLLSLGLVGALDVYPALTDSSSTFTQFSLMGQAGF